MNIGLDTNILVRHITNDDQEQVEKVQELFDSASGNTTFIINSIIVAELDWVLTHVYSYGRDQFLLVIDQLFETTNISFENPNLVHRACSLYNNSKADFSNCLIGVLNKDSGCETIYTFDKDDSQLRSSSELV